MDGLKVPDHPIITETVKGAESGIVPQFVLTRGTGILIAVGHFIESLQFIAELGYEITDIYPLGHDKQDMSLLEFDCIFRKRIRGGMETGRS